MGLLSIRGRNWSTSLGWRLAVMAVLALALGTIMVHAKSTGTAVLSESAAMDSVALSHLPSQAQRVFGLIHEGGPFRYEKDGTVFGNRERLLPRRNRGFYREYTVPTPGLKHRGARRIVCGGSRPKAPEACFYTEDHYASFRLIVH